LGTWEPLLGNLGTFTWEPLLGNLYLEPGNLGGIGFGAAPADPKPLLWLKTPKHSAVGEKDIAVNETALPLKDIKIIKNTDHCRL